MIVEQKLLTISHYLKHVLRILLPLAAGVNYGYLMYWLLTEDHRDLRHLLITVSFYGLFGVQLLLGLIGVRNHQIDKVAICSLTTSIGIAIYQIWFTIPFKIYIVCVAIAINFITFVVVILHLLIKSKTGYIFYQKY